jgi:hypothetical protein
MKDSKFEIESQKKTPYIISTYNFQCRLKCDSVIYKPGPMSILPLKHSRQFPRYFETIRSGPTSSVKRLQWLPCLNYRGRATRLRPETLHFPLPGSDAVNSNQPNQAATKTTTFSIPRSNAVRRASFHYLLRTVRAGLFYFFNFFLGSALLSLVVYICTYTLSVSTICVITRLLFRKICPYIDSSHGCV